MLFNSGIVAEASGKVGGWVASHNAGGQYFRKLIVPADKQSSYQQVLRNGMSYLAGRWNTLAAAEREAWETFAANVPILNRLGASIYISGRNWFLKANLPRLQAEGVSAVLNAAPTTFALAKLTTPTITLAAASTTASVAFENSDDWAKAALGYLLIYASRPQDAQVSFCKGPYRLAGDIDGAASPPVSPQNVTLPWPAGPVGSAVFFHVLCTNPDGRPSAVATFKSVVPAPP
jgi:hypothetical protein